MPVTPSQFNSEFLTAVDKMSYGEVDIATFKVSQGQFEEVCFTNNKVNAIGEELTINLIIDKMTVLLDSFCERICDRLW